MDQDQCPDRKYCMFFSSQEVDFGECLFCFTGLKEQLVRCLDLKVICNYFMLLSWTYDLDVLLLT